MLDVPCGHGRIANRLAERGARVTGLDADTFFLERARADFMRNRGSASVVERDGDLLVDRHNFDFETGREESERWIVRDGQVRRTAYSVRFYTYTELRALLLDVGFAAVAAVGHDGEPLTLESRRMLVVATR